jgi:hypothetical protein
MTITVLSPLSQELEAALFLQLGDAWAADCVREDVEDRGRARKSHGETYLHISTPLIHRLID